jgi:hypothetical protein
MRYPSRAAVVTLLIALVERSLEGGSSIGLRLELMSPPCGGIVY